MRGGSLRELGEEVAGEEVDDEEEDLEKTFEKILEGRGEDSSAEGTSCGTDSEEESLLLAAISEVGSENAVEESWAVPPEGGFLMHTRSKVAHRPGETEGVSACGFVFKAWNLDRVVCRPAGGSWCTKWGCAAITKSILRDGVRG